MTLLQSWRTRQRAAINKHTTTHIMSISNTNLPRPPGGRKGQHTAGRSSTTGAYVGMAKMHAGFHGTTLKRMGGLLIGFIVIVLILAALISAAMPAAQ